MMMKELFSEIVPVLEKREERYILVTMAAGLSMETISGFCNKEVPIIRIMPNTPVSAGEGMILYTANDFVQEEELTAFTDALAFAGRTYKME